MDRRRRAASSSSSSSTWRQSSRQTHQSLSLSAEPADGCSPGFLSTVFSDAGNGEPGILKRGAFRHLSCTSTPDVYIPATAASVIRASADWEPKPSRRVRGPHRRTAPTASSSVRGRRRSNACPDLWSSSHLPLTADAASSVGGLVPVEPAPGSRFHRRFRGQDTAAPITISSIGARSFGEHGIDAALGPSICEMADRFILLPRRRLRSLNGLDYQHELIREGSQVCWHCHGAKRSGFFLQDFHTNPVQAAGHDRFREWRLDVDDMSYEELVELGDQIGYVKTGLKDDEINVCVEKMKLCFLEREWRCSICLEEYRHEEHLGKLECGHEYHVCCIKKWLQQKSICPICKATVSEFNA
ncbi:uncharacterized protein LOC116263231 isoform X2 [Nymphaea colorata]|uniref:uncharacterized protein LOC116263231 isoform X2 n=1 Tax=Nymphaea colorata TaxID=210225 RepID=UPI00129E6221|nr:uncharacterized protein LOC116263231 isoform X2 [Nymphaea colorata]